MRIKAIVLDMDGTAVNYPNEPYNSSWDALAEIFPESKKKEWFELRDFYHKKSSSFYQEWFDKQVLFLKGFSVEEASKALFPIPYSKGFENFFSSINGNYKKGILSAGIELVASKIYEDFSFDFFFANPLEVQNGFFTGRGKSKIDLISKKTELEKIIHSFGMSLENICYVGDTLSDVPVLTAVGLPIAFNPKEKGVSESSRYTIYDFMELRNILSNEN